MKNVILTILFLVIGNVFAQTSIEVLNHKLDSIQKHSKLPGFGVAVLTPDTVVFEKGYGYADIAKKKKYTINTIQNIGSVSKTFVGVSLMKVIEQGKLTEDTPINDVLPFKVMNPKYPDVPILVKHLASHTSSILDTDTYEKSYVLENSIDIKEEDYTKKEFKVIKGMMANKKYELKDFLVNHLTPDGAWYKKGNFLKHKPGDRYEYSNCGSALLAYIIEIATGVPFTEYTQKHILTPLQMQASGWSYDAINKEEHACTYTETGNKIPEYSLITYPDGGFRSSISDLSKYFQAMMRGYYGTDEKILSSASFQTMMGPKLTKEQYNVKELKDNYGFYWENNLSGVIGHNGGDPGILTLMYFYKEDNLGAIFFTNTDFDEDKEIIMAIQETWNAIKQFRTSYVQQN